MKDLKSKSGQYFSENPTTKEIIYKFFWNIRNKEFIFNTSNSVFSKKAIDFGTMLMLESFIDREKEFTGSILDLGCGYGPVGVTLGVMTNASLIEMVDVNERAVMLSKMNVKENRLTTEVKIYCSDGFSNVEGSFDRILTNPPIRAGKEAVFSFYENSYDYLNENGMLYVVIQKKQGAESTKNKLEEVFNNCQMIKKKSGYFVFRVKKEPKS